MKPVHLDGWLYVIISVTGATGLGAMWASDEAKLYVAAWVLFWLKVVDSVLFGSATALKTYRSTTFAEHKKEQDERKMNVSTTVTEHVEKVASEVKPAESKPDEKNNNPTPIKPA